MQIVDFSYQCSAHRESISMKVTLTRHRREKQAPRTSGRQNRAAPARTASPGRGACAASRRRPFSLSPSRRDRAPRLTIFTHE